MTLTEYNTYDCLTLTDHLLTPHDELQEIPWSNTDFPWFTDGSYFKGDNSKYCAGYAITNLFDIVEAASLSMATSAQQTKLYALIQTCTLAKDKTANIYIDSKYTFRVAHDFGMLWKQHGFLTSSGNTIKLGPYVQELLNAMFLPATLAIIKILGHSKLDSLEVSCYFNKECYI